jgi:hypothetical protein
VHRDIAVVVKQSVPSQSLIDAMLTKKQPFLHKIELFDGKITQIYDLCSRYFQAYRTRITKWSQENARPEDVIHEIGKRLYFHALPHLRRFRMNIYNANSTEIVTHNESVQRDAWENLYHGIVTTIDTFERPQDKHDFVIALYSASLKVPTSGGKISDQIVMNRVVFPYLERALQHYGLAKRLVIRRKEDGTLDIQQVLSESWTYNPENDEPQTFTDILEYQKFHAKYSKVIHTTSKRV